MSPIDEIKSKLDIVTYIQQYASLKRAGRTYKAPCPFHSEKTPSFVVNPDRQTWRCFGACGEGGDIFSFAQKYHNWTFPEAIEALGRLAGVETRAYSPIDRQKDAHKDRLRGIMQAATEFYHQQLMNGSAASADVLRYLKEKRGFSDETIARYQMGYAPEGWQNLYDAFTKLGYSEDDLIMTGLVVKNEQGRVYDRFRHRLMIPIRDERGRPIAFGARALTPDEQPKYLNSPQTPLFDKSKTLFGLDVAKSTISKSDIAVIVEGYMDVIQAHQAGFYQVVAQMGTALTETQLKLLAPRYAKKVIIALDSDVAGQNATRKSIEVAREVLQRDYSARFQVEILVLQIPSAKDPDDLIRETPEVWQQLVAEAIPAVEFVITMALKDLPQGQSIREMPIWEREAIAKEILPIISISQNENFRRDNLQRLATRLLIDYIVLYRLSEKYKEEHAQKNTLRVLPNPTHRDDMPADAIGSQPPPSPYEDMLPVLDAPDGKKSEWDWKPVIIPKIPDINSERLMEVLCLRMLLIDDKVYYQIARKFRALAMQDELLLRDVLSPLSPRDFVQTECRVVMEIFEDAIAQQEQDYIVYVDEHLPPSLQEFVIHLKHDTQYQIRARLKNRFEADINDIMQAMILEQTQEQVQREGVMAALKLRRMRLVQEMQDHSFMLADFQTDEEPEIYDKLRTQVKHLTRAIRAIDTELKEILRA